MTKRSQDDWGRSEVKIMAELLSAMSENGSGLSIHTELLSAMSENRSGLSIHTECSIHTGTSDSQAFKCSKEIYIALHSHSHSTSGILEI